MTNRFDQVNLSVNDIMKRMIKMRQREDNYLIEKCALEAEKHGEDGYCAASAIRKFKTEGEKDG